MRRDPALGARLGVGEVLLDDDEVGLVRSRPRDDQDHRPRQLEPVVEVTRVDTRDGVVRVRFQLDRSGQLVEPKTKTAKRDVPIPASMARALAEHRLASLFSSGTDFVFASENGTPLQHRNVVRRGLEPALKVARLPHLRWHDLRHLAASALIADETSADDVSRMLGHANAAITQTIYTHEFEAQAFQTESSSYVDVPGATATISIGRDGGALLIRFAASVECFTGIGKECFVRALINGTEAEPGAAGFADPRSRFSSSAQAMDWSSGELPRGKYTVQMQASVDTGDEGDVFVIDRWHLTVERLRV